MLLGSLFAFVFGLFVGENVVSRGKSDLMGLFNTFHGAYVLHVYKFSLLK